MAKYNHVMLDSTARALLNSGALGSIAFYGLFKRLRNVDQPSFFDFSIEFNSKSEKKLRTG